MKQFKPGTRISWDGTEYKGTITGIATTNGKLFVTWDPEFRLPVELYSPSVMERHASVIGFDPQAVGRA